MKIESIKEEYFYKSLENKKIIIEKQIELQEQKKNMLFEYCDTIMNVISIAKNVDNNWDEILTELKQTMEILLINMQKLKSMKNEIINIINYAKEIVESNINLEEKQIQLNKLEQRIIEYNEEEEKEYPNILDKTKENEELINKIIKNANEILSKENAIKDEKKIETNKNSYIKNNLNNIETRKANSNDVFKSNKTLIVSELDGKVYLPYYEEDIVALLKKSRNKSVEEIVAENYILDLARFKNPITSRFKESYILIRKREKGKIVEAIELGMELMLNYKLNPAVIAACRTEDELDIYLDCLEENELEMFDIFNIKYISAPVVVKNKNKHSFY